MSITAIKIPFSSEADELLFELSQRGGVADFVLCKIDSPNGLNEESHLKAADLALSHIAERYNKTRVSPLSLKGQSLSHEDFFGTSVEVKEKNLWNTQVAKKGIANALMDPPHGIKKDGPSGSPYELYQRILKIVFGGPETVSLQYFWNTDCSSYFDTGREWWGTYFGTIDIPSQNLIVVILASSSD